MTNKLPKEYTKQPEEYTKLPKEYTEENRIEYTSAAYTTYMRETDPEFRSEFEARLKEEPESEDDRLNREYIEQLTSPDVFFKLMRKPMNMRTEYAFRKEMLKKEDLIMEMVKKRAMTNMLDSFVDHATCFFINCKEDPSGWIAENYDNIRNPYTQSMMCLVLGFRGDESHMDFLLEQAEDLTRKFPGESFEQGPIVALYMLEGANRYL